jgi:hypothetical protein
MSHQQAPASAGSYGYHHRGSGATVGDSHRGPLNNQGKPTFSQITEHKRTHQRKIRLNNHGSQTRAHGPGGPSSPPEQSAPATLERDSASLEGHGPVLTELRLAQGLDAPSSKAPPRSRLSRARRPRTYSPGRCL